MNQSKGKKLILFLLLFCVTSVIPILVYSQTVVRIISQLKEGEIQENVKITIGQSTQVLTVNRFNSVAYVDFYLSRPGTYPCRIESNFQLYGEYFVRRGLGSGNLSINGGEIFGVVSDCSQNPCQLSLQVAGQLQMSSNQNQMRQSTKQPQLNESQKRLRIQQIDAQIRQLQSKIEEEERRLNYYQNSGDGSASATNTMLQQSILNLIQSYNNNIMILEREKAQLSGY